MFFYIDHRVNVIRLKIANMFAVKWKRKTISIGISVSRYTSRYDENNFELQN